MPAVRRWLVNQGSGPIPSLATGHCALEPSTTPGLLVGDLCTEIFPPALTPAPHDLFLEG